MINHVLISYINIYFDATLHNKNQEPHFSCKFHMALYFLVGGIVIGAWNKESAPHHLHVSLKISVVIYCGACPAYCNLCMVRGDKREKTKDDAWSPKR